MRIEVSLTGMENHRKRIYIIRHGETDYNRKKLMQGRGIDAPLNETGRRQAEALARYMSGQPIDLLVSSSMQRARQTAEFLARNNGKDIISHEDLDEMHFGHWEGRSYETFTDDIIEVGEQWSAGRTDHPVPGGESPEEVLRRAGGRIETILTDNNGVESFAFVVHGRLIRILLASWTGIGLQNMEQIEHTNCGVNFLHRVGSEFEVVFMNRTDHLLELKADSSKLKAESR